MKIIIARSDGGVSVMTVINHDTPVAVLVSHWQDAQVMTGWTAVSFREVTQDDLDASGIHQHRRDFREAFGHDLQISVPKAQEITRNRLRAERAPLLAALDIQQLNAVDDSAKAVVLAKKQRLRDLPSRVDGVSDIDHLLSLSATNAADG